MKKLFLTFLAALCCMSGFANGIKIDNIYYLLDNTNKTATVTYAGETYIEGSEYTGSINIPSTVSYNNQVYSVTSIRDYAFFNCSSLTSITIPEGVTSIGNYTFENCSSLTSITIPEGVTSIRIYTFENCSSLTSITIPSGVTSIGERAFQGCSSLTSITIPESVTSIEQHAFQDCSALTSITIPSGVTSIGKFVFSGCSGLTSITIPSGVTSIGEYAFEYCKSLTSITIPEGVESIGNAAFTRCLNLTSFVVFATNPPKLGTNIFRGIINTVTIYVPDVQAYKNWEGFANIKEWRLDDHKQYAIGKIEDAMESVELPKVDEELISICIDQINNAEYIADVIAAKEKALAIIRLRPAKNTAIAAIHEAMQGETGSAYLNGLVKEYVDAINAATDESTITNNKNTAISKIELFLSAYKAGISEKLGGMDTPPLTDCPAVRVTKGEKEVILYAPDAVEMIKVSANK